MNDRSLLSLLAGFLCVAGVLATATAQTVPDFVVTTLADVTDDEDGETSLREAILAANADPSASVIGFAPALTGTIDLTGSLPVLESDLEIRGPGPDQLTVRRDTGWNSYIFAISPNRVITLRGMTIADRQTLSSAPGISSSYCELKIDNCHFTEGGALDCDWGSIEISNSTFSGFIEGRAINCLGARVLMTDTLVCDNGTFENNAEPDAAVALFASEVFVRRTTFGNNTTFNQGHLRLERCVSIVTDCVFHGNLAHASHGAIEGHLGELLVMNSTLSENVTEEVNYTTGIHLFDCDLELRNTTIHDRNAPLQSKAINVYYNSTIILGNTILDSRGYDLFVDNSSTVNSLGHNLSNDSTGPASGPGDQRNVDPLLEPLADNGGPTLTHALQAGSPAIDAGANALAMDPDDQPLLHDQRGHPRIQPGGDPAHLVIDIGAFEAGGSVVFTGTPLFLDASPSAIEGTVVDLVSLVGAFPVGGTFSGNGVNSAAGTFDTAGLAVGEVVPITYGIRDGAGGTSSAPLQIIVTEAPGLTVTTSADPADETDDETTLREAIAYANEKPGPDTIDFAPEVLGSIDLTSPLPTIIDDINIRGPGADRLTVRRVSGGNYRIFTVSPSDLDYILASPGGFTVSLSGLTVSNGSAEGFGVEGCGGGIYFSRVKSSTLSGMILSDNQADQGGGAYIATPHPGALLIENSTFRRNAANRDGGGIYTADGGSVTIRNSTIVENNGETGGAIYTISTGPPIQVLNCTLAGNETGIAQVLSDVVIRNSILSNGGATELFSLLGDLGDEVNEVSHSLLRTLPTLPLNGTGNLIGVDPMLGPLQDNGGPTPTLALLSGSPAIDAGNPDFDPGTLAPPLVADQRGMARIQQGLAATGAPRIDLGAYEFIGIPELHPSGERVPDLPIPVDLTQVAGATMGGGTFSGPGVQGNHFSGAGLSPGEYELTYTVTDGYGATNQSTFTTEVFDGYLRPDLRSGDSGDISSHQGNDVYGDGQNFSAKSSRSRAEFFFSVENDGNVSSRLVTGARGISRKDYRVQILEVGGGGNVTAAILSSGYERGYDIDEIANYRMSVRDKQRDRRSKTRVEFSAVSSLLPEVRDQNTVRIKLAPPRTKPKSGPSKPTTLLRWRAR